MVVIPSEARDLLFRYIEERKQIPRALGMTLFEFFQHPGGGSAGSSRKRQIGATLRLALIAIFGAIGTLARYGLQGLVQFRAGSTFPYGTLLINLTGCFLLGLIGQFTLNRMVISPDWRVAIAVGFFGGYPTFSSFGWETAKMLEDGGWARAAAYVTASVVAGLFLSVAGIRLANQL